MRKKNRKEKKQEDNDEDRGKCGQEPQGNFRYELEPEFYSEKQNLQRIKRVAEEEEEDHLKRPRQGGKSRRTQRRRRSKRRTMKK
jgi:hypothetical protein